ncbi:MAG: hypothetical protein AMXMBFR4_11960 [Candidatus Hydrogenedentota bacterium]
MKKSNAKPLAFGRRTLLHAKPLNLQPCNPFNYTPRGLNPTLIEFSFLLSCVVYSSHDPAFFSILLTVLSIL